MGRKPGVQSVPKDMAQKKVLELLAQGTTITDAMLAVGRNDVTFRQWSMQNPDFKAEADKARLAWLLMRCRPLVIPVLFPSKKHSLKDF